MQSLSSLTITWVKPNLDDERWEYFSHPAKQSWYRNHCTEWNDIVSSFDDGMLIQYPRAGIIGTVPVALAYHEYSDYQHYLGRAKRGYRRSYTKMEDDLQQNGSLEMKAPILLLHENEALLFSGYRRLCLAWNYGMIPYIWLVSL